MPTADDFAAFYSAVHRGRQPFPWQQALIRRIVAEGRWPDVIDVPTGLGKTSVLDVAVFVAALGVEPARRRIFYVVDRRLVVDEAHEHAQRIRAALADPGTDGIVAWVADRLRQPGDDRDAPLDVTRMRGGVTWERTWLDRPDRHAIVTGTVDQIGSRLLFRGYGVSERARSIDAALVGTDSLIVIDEAHLAAPLITTFSDALAMDTTAVAPKPTLVTMSATVSASASNIHRITEEDARHEVAGARLRARKQMRLVEVATSRRAWANDVAVAVAKMATTLADTGVVGVVMNTVAMARRVFELAREHHEAILLTGATRQVDRDYLLARYYNRISVERATGAPPLVVVATQTVEVGANVDFDALITESAPMPSLVQRLGRLNRIGRRATVPAQAVVVHNSAVTEEDPVYGPARLSTYQWLSAHVTPERYTPRLDLTQDGQQLDASPEALRRLVSLATDEERAAMWPRERYTPVLFKSTLDSWVRTSPTPVPDQPVAPFLHGISDDREPVTVVWRSRATQEDVVALPPTAEEGLELSVAAVRRWLLGRKETGGSDMESQFAPEAGDDVAEVAQPAAATVLRMVRAGERPVTITPYEVRPGDVIVVPAAFGGCDEFGWHPTSTTPAMDVADLALRRGRPVLRLGPSLRDAFQQIDDWQGTNLAPLVQRLVDQAASDAVSGNTPSMGTYRELLAEMGSQPGLLRPLEQLLRALTSRNGLRVTITADADGEDELAVLLASGRPLGTVTTGRALLMDDDSPAGSSTTVSATVEPRPLGLDAHERAVASRAREFATNLGLSERLVETVAFAARWHDEGKRDPRFQAMLWRGDRLAAEVADEPLAKSGMDPFDRAALRRAAVLAEYPRGMRHEALSAQIAAARSAEADIDRQLAIHLVMSHHGYGRGLLPPIRDPNPVKVHVPSLGVFDSANTIDWDQPSRFMRLNETYGRWGLALLETVVRLADIWCSARNEAEDEAL